MDPQHWLLVAVLNCTCIEVTWVVIENYSVIFAAANYIIWIRILEQQFQNLDATRYRILKIQFK